MKHIRLLIIPILIVLMFPHSVSAEASNDDIVNSITSLQSTLQAQNEQLLNQQTQINSLLQQQIDNQVQAANTANTNNNWLQDNTQPAVPNSTSSGATSFTTFFPPVGPLGNLVTNTTAFLSSIISPTCSQFNLPLPFIGGNLSIPCLSTRYPSSLGLVSIIINGSVVYALYRKIAQTVREAQDPESKHDEFMNV